MPCRSTESSSSPARVVHERIRRALRLRSEVRRGVGADPMACGLSLPEMRRLAVLPDRRDGDAPIVDAVHGLQPPDVDHRRDGT